MLRRFPDVPATRRLSIWIAVSLLGLCLVGCLGTVYGTYNRPYYEQPDQGGPR